MQNYVCSFQTTLQPSQLLPWKWELLGLFDVVPSQPESLYRIPDSVQRGCSAIDWPVYWTQLELQKSPLWIVPAHMKKIKSCIRRGWPHVTGPFVWKTLLTVSFVHVDVFTNFRGAQAKYWHWEEHNSHLFLVKFGKVKAHGSWGHGLIK